MKRVSVEITKEDIAKGARGSTGYCPIAQAFERTFPGCRPIVTKSMVEFGYKDGRLVTRIHNTSIPYFIKRFDREGKMQPFTLSFPLLEPGENMYTEVTARDMER